MAEKIQKGDPVGATVKPTGCICVDTWKKTKYQVVSPYQDRDGDIEIRCPMCERCWLPPGDLQPWEDDDQLSVGDRVKINCKGCKYDTCVEGTSGTEQTVRRIDNCGRDGRWAAISDITPGDRNCPVANLTRVEPEPKSDTTCYLVFKDSFCRYEGGAATCDKSFEACRDHGNEAHFPGMPMPYEKGAVVTGPTVLAGENCRCSPIPLKKDDRLMVTATTAAANAGELTITFDVEDSEPIGTFTEEMAKGMARIAIKAGIKKMLEDVPPNCCPHCRADTRCESHAEDCPCAGPTWVDDGEMMAAADRLERKKVLDDLASLPLLPTKERVRGTGYWRTD